MIRNIAVVIATILLFAVMAWTTIAATDTSDTTQPAEVHYDLPYPGILPDSPLYGLKTFRDKIISFFITDAKKQAQFDLLQSDKRLVAGQYMLANHSHSDKLISETISKGQNYYAQSITNAIAAKKQGIFTDDFMNTLHDAGLKHIEVMNQMSQQTSGQLHKDIEGDIEVMKKYENQVGRLMQQK